MRSHRLSARFRPRVEGLEDRRLLSISVPTPGTPGPAAITGTPGRDQFLIRLEPGTPANIQFSDNGGATFTTAALVDVTEVTVAGQNGRDRLTLDHANGFIGKADPGLTVRFDGGAGRDEIVVSGDPEVTVNQTYVPGLTTDAGTLTAVTADATLIVSFVKTSAVTDTLTAVSTTINFTDNPNFVHVGKSRPVTGQQLLKIGGIDFQRQEDTLNNIPVDDNLPDRILPAITSFVPITLGNQTTVSINSLGANDLFVINAPKTVPGLTTLNLDGGAGTDRAIVAGLPRGVTTNFVGFERRIPDAVEDSFVLELYISRLKRLASETEIELWRPLLRRPGGREAIIAGIERSPEARTRIVKDWYEAYLGRTANGGEEQGWVRGLVSGASDEQVLSGILGSSEYLQRVGGITPGITPDDRFVRSLYENLFARTPGFLERAGWVAALQFVPRSVVVQGFLFSPEFRSNLLTEAYSELLDRSPDASGLRSWLSSGLDATRIREGFFASLEFFDDDLVGASGITFDAGGRATLQGTSLNHDDKQFYQFTPLRNAALNVTVRGNAGRFAQLEIETALGIDVFETEPNNGVNSGRVALTANTTYSVRLRSPDDRPAAFTVELTLA